MGRKGIACNQSQTFYHTLFAYQPGAVAQFYWLVARQSKSDMKNLTVVDNRHPEYKTTNKIKKIWPSPWKASNFLFRKR